MRTHSRLVHSPSEVNTPSLPILQARDFAAQVQPKLRIGGSSSAAELQAEKLAQSLDDPHPLQGQPLAQSMDGGFLLPDHFPQRLARASRSGRPVPSAFQKKIGAKLGADLRNVRLHVGPESAQLNEELGARAFTVGPHVHFGDNEYDPSSASGQQLLAHELTHTAQQGQGGAPLIQCSPKRALAIARQAKPEVMDGIETWDDALSFCAAELGALLEPLNQIAEEDEILDPNPLAQDHPLAPYDELTRDYWSAISDVSAMADVEAQPAVPDSGQAAAQNDADFASGVAVALNSPQDLDPNGDDAPAPVLQNDALDADAGVASSLPLASQWKFGGKRLEAMAKNSELADAVDAFSPSFRTRFKRGIRPMKAINMSPFGGMIRQFLKHNKEDRRARAMRMLAEGGIMPDIVRAALETTANHAELKRKVALAQTFASGVTSTLAVADAGLSSLVSSLVDPLVSNAAQTAISIGSGLSGTPAAKGGVGWLVHKLARRRAPMANTFAEKHALQGKRVMGASLLDHRVNRAMLYHLGHAGRLGWQGNISQQNAENGRQGLRQYFGLEGAHKDMDLKTRQPRNLKRGNAIAKRWGWFGRQRDKLHAHRNDFSIRGKNWLSPLVNKEDWLTDEERSWYTKLKEGKAHYEDVPKHCLLPILWQANKIFDYHAKYLQK